METEFPNYKENLKIDDSNGFLGKDTKAYLIKLKEPSSDRCSSTGMITPSLKGSVIFLCSTNRERLQVGNIKQTTDFADEICYI